MPNEIKRWNGSQWVSVLREGVSTNDANRLVLRDGSGNFSAGTITAALSGNATTATTLQTARNINGVSFNGSANITVPADANTLTGTTLASGVTASSLQSVGTLSALTVSGTVTLNGSSVLVPTTNASLTLGSDPVSGQRLRLHRTATDSYIDFATGSLFFRSDGNSNDLVIQNNGVTVIDKPSHIYCGTVEQSTAQAIPDVTWRPIIFNVAGTDYASMHDHTATGAGGDGFQLNTRVIIPIAGFWQFWTQVPIADSINGRRYIQIRRYNSAGTLQQGWQSVQDAGDTGTDLGLQAIASFECAANDFIQVWYYHNSGASRNTIVNADTFGSTNAEIGQRHRPKLGWTLLRATP